MESVLELAKQGQAIQTEIDRNKGDWRRQLEQLNETVKMVGNWQKPLFKKFGTENGLFNRIFFRDRYMTIHVFGHRHGSTDIKPGAVVDFEITNSYNWKGATIVQWMTRENLENGDTLIHYEATLKIDENHFLTGMLPITVSIADPDYTLIKLEILIPKAELIKESIHLVSAALR